MSKALLTYRPAQIEAKVEELIALLDLIEGEAKA